MARRSNEKIYIFLDNSPRVVRQDGKFGCFRELVLVLVLEAVTDRQMRDKREEFSLGVCVFL